MTRSFTIALDGPAAAGKGTIARSLARIFNLPYLDTGLLYRAVGYKVSLGEDPLQSAKNLTESDFADPTNLRTREAGEYASQVAADPQIRSELIDFQRKFARRDGGAILDGRDIGTIICPEAEVKFFVTASDRVRAARRYAELVHTNPELTLEDIYADLKKRDERDQARQSAPMVAAHDALLLDTTKLSIDAAVAIAVQYIEQIMDKETLSQQ